MTTQSKMIKACIATAGSAVLAFVSAGWAQTAEGPPPAWRTVVNNGTAIPGYPGRFFNSYNPPSVNARGLVVFRARSTGRQQGPVSGIFTRYVSGRRESAIQVIATRDSEVPQPNNTTYPVPGGQGAGILATFNEFPSFPRIAVGRNVVATRGNHQPVWTYVIGTDPDTGEPVETRAGTTGVYVNLNGRSPNSSPLVTGASLLGEVPDGAYVDFSYLFRVPGVEPVTRFEVFPGAPAVTNQAFIAFKGNYSVPDPADPGGTLGKTGVFYRRVATDYAGGPEPISLIANSDTVIPNPGDCAAGTTFGSTAPPSAAGRRAVFVGLDNEDDPTCGGIYSGRLGTRRQKITTFVGLDTAVPGAGGQTFARIGEGLSYDGRFVGFWGAWGEATHTVRLYCPVEGNRDRRAFCNNTGVFDPDTGTRPGDPNSVCDDRSDPNYPLCYQEKEVPDRQGIFVYDSETGGLRLVAETSDDGPFSDFVYWNYSGAPPGVGHGETDAEPPRFRSSAFLAVSQLSGATVRTAFLSRTGDLDDGTNTWIDPIDGIYLAKSADSGAATVQTLLQTGMDGTLLDPEAVWDDDENPATPDVPLPITTLALEREAFRGGRLAISAKMGTEEAGWAGIYLGQL